eukprot:TRINITY_DN25807_c0_g2_i4.p2 TRINITY_DN25807_c0_g2~~TRINITY_DN25807_c0_g2_i4.p2  ORF type:complete len:107 (+),score=8.45 TRINITY_DN25807_c0_g2_i4:1-321(+)
MDQRESVRHVYWVCIKTEPHASERKCAPRGLCFIKTEPRGLERLCAPRGLGLYQNRTMWIREWIREKVCATWIVILSKQNYVDRRDCVRHVDCVCIKTEPRGSERK